MTTPVPVVTESTSSKAKSAEPEKLIAGLPDAGERLPAATSTAKRTAWAAACRARAAGRLDDHSATCGTALGPGQSSAGRPPRDRAELGPWWESS
ncbi:MAG: hypothetical protein JWP48_3567 [Actinoallomurus sp.]|jgi:hypothetical protein|nr:hypothetical protein [Actinoallomurus sp.]